MPRGTECSVWVPARTSPFSLGMCNACPLRNCWIRCPLEGVRGYPLPLSEQPHLLGWASHVHRD